MKAQHLNVQHLIAALAAASALVWSLPAAAHCDTLDGPVVAAARKALDSGNVNLVLVWVQTKDDAEIRNHFEKTVAVRKVNAQAKELADMYFFETLVRIHRAGEGAPYTGLKPAGRDLGPAIPAADKAVESGKVDALLKLLSETVQAEVREKFKHVMARKKYQADDIEAGREFIEAYTAFVEHVERIFETAKGPAEGHPRPSTETIEVEGEKC